MRKCWLCLIIMRLFVLLLLISPILNLSAENVNSSSPRGKSYLIMTIPKSGTHLVAKLSYALAHKEVIVPGAYFTNLDHFFFWNETPGRVFNLKLYCYYLHQWRAKNFVPIMHFNFSEPTLYYVSKFPQTPVVIMIRDLRDVCVSETFFHEKELDSILGEVDFDTKLLYVINQNNESNKQSLFNIYKFADRAIQWIHKDKYLLCRFEDLVGSRGGGTDQVQREKIVEFANYLSIELSEEELNNVQNGLFGIKEGPTLPGKTFRSGQIGSWKKYFKPLHIHAFKKNLGALQEALGYSCD